MRTLGLTNGHPGRENAMKSVAKAMSGQTVIAAADTGEIRRDGTLGGSSVVRPAVADKGKIRLGGAYRRPASRQAA